MLSNFCTLFCLSYHFCEQCIYIGSSKPHAELLRSKAKAEPPFIIVRFVSVDNVAAALA